MATWAIIAVAAAFCQNLRSLLQKRLTDALSVHGASYARFLFALPFAFLYLLAVTLLRPKMPLPDMHWAFVGISFIGAIAQILATLFLLASFRERNFAGATALSKTETLQAAVYGLLILGDEISLSLALALPASLIGVFLLGGLRLDRSAWLGLLSGAAFAVAAVSYRAAALSLPEGDAVVRAALTLAVTLTLQTLAMGLYVTVRDRRALFALWRERRAGVWVGLAGALASIGWFTAMAMVNAALVRVVGQIELVFAFATSVWLFRERVTAREIAGALLIVGGILILV